VETKNKKMLSRNWIFPYTFLFSFLWEYSLVGIFKMHPLQDQFYFDSPFDEVFVFNIVLASFILASVCIVLCSLVRILNNNTEGREIPSQLWTIGFVMLHGGILPLLPSCIIWQAWPFDAYMISLFYLAWLPAAVAGPVLWWFLLRLLNRERTVTGQFDVIDDELASGSKQV
jgi:hypothetical protein